MNYAHFQSGPTAGRIEILAPGQPPKTIRVAYMRPSVLSLPAHTEMPEEPDSAEYIALGQWFDHYGNHHITYAPKAEING